MSYLIIMFLQCPASLSKMHTHLPGVGEAHMPGNDHSERGGGQLGPFCTSNIEPDSNHLRHLPVRVDGLLYTKPQQVQYSTTQGLGDTVRSGVSLSSLLSLYRLHSPTPGMSELTPGNHAQ